MNKRSLNKRDLLKVIDKSTEDLHQQVDMYRYIMTSILDRGVKDTTIKGFSLSTSCSDNENRLREAIREAIDILEESRKAFKSKKLELLRKRLTDVLIESN